MSTFRQVPVLLASARLTTVLLALGVWAAAWQLAVGGTAAARAGYVVGVLPAVLTSRARLPAELDVLPAPLTLLTSLVPEAGLLPAAWSLLFLLVFAPHVETALGWRRFLVFYAGCGVFAALAEVLAAPAATLPVMGAAGAVSGVIAASLLLAPRRRLLAAAAAPGNVPVVLLAPLWLGGVLAMAPGTAAVRAGLGWPGCLGGFLCGLILVLFLKRREVPLLDTTAGTR